MSTAAAATVPQTLKELHRLRKHLRELQSEIDLGPRVLKIRQQTLAAEEQAHKDAYEAIKKLKLKQKDDEGTLKTATTQLAKYEKQLSDAASPKEYDGKQSEIRQAKAKIAGLEDAILAAMTDIEDRTAKLPDVEKQWADARGAFEQYKADARDRLERLQNDQKATQGELEKREQTLPPEVKGPYERLVKSYGPDGLAGVVGRSCQHCRTALPEQQRHDLVNGGWMCCPRCGRGLYLAD